MTSITSRRPARRATIAVDNEGSQTHTVYHRYFKTADEDDTNLHINGNADTVKGPIVFTLPGLTAATEYKVEASLQSYFPTNQSEFDIFPTKPNKPTGLTVTPGDRQLELEWTKPARWRCNRRIHSAVEVGHRDIR